MTVIGRGMVQRVASFNARGLDLKFIKELTQKLRIAAVHREIRYLCLLEASTKFSLIGRGTSGCKGIEN